MAPENCSSPHAACRRHRLPHSAAATDRRTLPPSRHLTPTLLCLPLYLRRPPQKFIQNPSSASRSKLANSYRSRDEGRIKQEKDWRPASSSPMAGPPIAYPWLSAQGGGQDEGIHTVAEELSSCSPESCRQPPSSAARAAVGCAVRISVGRRSLPVFGPERMGTNEWSSQSIQVNGYFVITCGPGLFF
jgi:hypothetical protein